MIDEVTAPVWIAIITGGFGVVSLLITQWFAKRKSGNIKPSSQDMAAALSDNENVPKMDYLATIKHAIIESRRSSTDDHSDIKDLLRDIKSQNRDLYAEIRDLRDR